MKEPKVVQEIRQAAHTHRVRRLADLQPGVHTRLAQKMAGYLKINVLEAFHGSKPVDMEPLYSWNRSDDAIVLKPGALQFIRRERVALEAISNLWWARYLEKVNELAPRIIRKVERNGAQRGSLARYLKILRDLDAPECFYCGAGLVDGPAVHVDHVIPWSFLLTDPLWDLVLACNPCNLSKSDVLPQRAYLDKLVLVHQRRTRVTSARGISLLSLPEEELMRFYEAAISVEWPTGWAPTTPRGV
jgi:5-methylcytosine-specific restriction endonuclease McrA